MSPKKVTPAAQKSPAKPSKTPSPTETSVASTGLQPGDAAPAFAAPTQDGSVVKLSDYKGKKVVLYFYPKDDTPGCTQEACQYRDDYSAFQKQGIVVLGVSPDTEKKHAKFAEKFSLPFPLLADVEKQIATAYGVWVEKSMYGRKYMGVERSTFLIDEKGKIARVMRKVHPAKHVAELLSAK